MCISFSECPNRRPVRTDPAPAESGAALTPTGVSVDASHFAPGSRALSTHAASNSTSPLRPNSNWPEISVSAAQSAALIAVRHRSIPAPARLSLGVVIRRRQSWWHAKALTVEEVQRHSNGTVERPESASTNGETPYVPIVALADASGRRGQRHRNFYLTQVHTVLRTTERQIQMTSLFTHLFRTLPHETDRRRSAIF